MSSLVGTLRHPEDLRGWPIPRLEALAAADLLATRGFDVGVLNARFAKPLDEEVFADALTGYPLLVTVEDHFRTGGFGSAVLEFAADLPGARARVLRLGIPDRYLPHAGRRRQLEWAGLTAEKIAESVAGTLVGEESADCCLTAVASWRAAVGPK